MVVAVYPRLAELLRARHLTLSELHRQIEQRFGISVDSGALELLVEARPVRQTDLEVVGAAASVLGVGLGELFEVVPIPASLEEERFLSPEQSGRLAALFDLRARRGLSEAEAAELDHLVAENGRTLEEHLVREIARKRGQTVEQVREESDASLHDALAWWREIQADPRRYQELVTELKHQRRARR